MNYHFLCELFSRYIKLLQKLPKEISGTYNEGWISGQADEDRYWLEKFGVDLNYWRIQPMIDGKTKIETRLSYIKTDDHQYISRRSDTRFHVIDVIDHRIVSSEVDIRDYRGDDHWTAEAEDIIKSYYESVQVFQRIYPDEDTQLQLFAEMAFESMLTAEYSYVSDEYSNEEALQEALEKHKEKCILM